MQPHADAVGNGLCALQQANADVEIAARGNRGREQYVARFDLRGFDTSEVEGGAPPGVGDLDGATMVLYATHTRTQARRGVQNVARANLPTPQRPRHNYAYALEHERAIHGQPRQIIPAPVDRISDQCVQCQQQVSDALSGRAAHLDQRSTDVALIQQVLDLQGGQLHGLLIYGIDFRERDDPLLYTKDPQDIEVLAGLGHDPVIGGDDEQEGVDPCRPRDHVLDEALVARHVDQAGPPSARKVKLRVPWHDGDAPAVFLFQPVGIGARHVPDERGLAVVNMPRRPYGEGYPVPAGLTHSRL
jgi:hypothetical protein